MGNKFQSIVLIAAICLLPVANGVAQQQDQKTIIEKGQRVFSGSCGMSYCHGYNGVGGGGPKLRDREFTAASLTRMIANGIPGTSMPAFKTSLKKEQIEQVVAFLFTVNKEINSAKPPVDPHFSGGGAATSEVPATAAKTPLAAMTGEASGLTGDVSAGESLFFDASQMQSCRGCHTLHGRGGMAASDLTRLAGQPPREILQRVLSPSPDGKYQNLAVTLKTGERITGIFRDEDQTAMRMYDTSSLPPISRGLLKSEIATTEKLAASGCAGNTASKLTVKQLLDLVAFIKTADPAKPAVVSLKDIL